MAVDRSNDIAKIYDKTGKSVVTGDKGQVDLAITGLPSGTVVPTGDYKTSWTDSTSKIESGKVDVEGFTVLETPADPTDVKSAATEDGAKVTLA